MYNYTFRPFAAHSFLPVCHILCWPSVQPVVEYLKKLRRPCAHGWSHVCTRTSYFLLVPLVRLHKHTKIVLFAEVGHLQSRKFYECRICYLCMLGFLLITLHNPPLSKQVGRLNTTACIMLEKTGKLHRATYTNMYETRRIIPYDVILYFCNQKNFRL